MSNKKNIELIRKEITTTDDFPAKGIRFYNLLPIFSNQIALAAFEEEAIKALSEFDFNKIAGIDARGFIFSSYLAKALKKNLIFFRKAGKLPPPTIKEQYVCEYAEASIEATSDCIKKGDRILIIDDVLATGNTVKAAETLVERLNGEVAGAFFALELNALKGGQNIKKYKYSSIIAI